MTGRITFSWTATVVCVGLTALYGGLFFWPRQQAIRRMQAECETKTEAVAQTARLEPRRALLEKQLSAAKEYASQWERQGIAEDQFAPFLSQVSGLVAASNAKTTKFEPLAATEYRTMRVRPLMLEIQGSYRSVSSVLAGVEAMSAGVWADELHFQKKEKDGENVECQIRLLVFVDHPKKSD